jgi:hypothetical protein
MKTRLVGTLVALAALFTAGTASADPVKLLFANTQFVVGGGGGGTSGTVLTAYVEVDKTYGTTRSVTGHYSVNGGTWTDAAGTFVAATHGNFEAWVFTIPAANPPAQGQDLTWAFAIKYTANGTDHWDNNGFDGTGNPINYNMSLGTTAPAQFVKQAVLFADRASYVNSGGVKTISGDVYVQNNSPTKTVTIRYSTDNWSTYSDLGASYAATVSPGSLNNPPSNSSNDASWERWHYSYTVPNATTSVVFAVYTTQNGTTSWDNNFTSNYVIATP